jgi:hypothetical protein
MPPKTNIVFDPLEIITSCETAAAAGDTSFRTVFTLDTKPRTSAQSKYLSLSATVKTASGAIKTGRLRLRMRKELHSSTIHPVLAVDVAEMNAAFSGGKYGEITARDRDPAITIRKFLNEDDKTVVSKYYLARQYINTFVVDELQARLDAGTMYRRPPPGGAPEGGFIVPSVDIVLGVQTHVSHNSTENPGGELENPMTRSTIKFDNKTTLPKKAIFKDYSSGKVTDGVLTFDDLTFDGSPVTANNVHGIKSKSIISGIVDMDAVCCSSFGLSLPTSMTSVYVELPVFAEEGAEAVFDEDEMGSFPVAAPTGGGAAAAPVAAAPVAAAPVAAAPAAAGGGAAIPEDDLEGLLEGM